ncbi:MAG: zinc-binding dehydrogenase [Acidobacteriota bacterium]
MHGDSVFAGSIPPQMRALVLEGKGFEALAVRTVPTPKPGPRQLLGRVNAAGICTSLIKLVEQGSDHPLLGGWDVARFPLILGDEGVVTICEVGSDLATRYSVGERYATQPAVDHCPINHRERYRDGGQGIWKVAVGYTLPGHLAEYMLIPEEVLEAGCLLPLGDSSLPDSHAATAEPLSCVISAQAHHVHLHQDTPLAPRTASTGLRAGGITVVIGAGAMGRMHVDLAISYKPRVIVVSDMINDRLARVQRMFTERAGKSGIRIITVDPNQTDLKQLVDELSDWEGADDVIVAVGSREAIGSAQPLLRKGGVLNLFGGLKKGQDMVPLDTTAIHYRELIITGSSGGSPWDVARALELMKKGALDPSAHITRIGDLEHSIEFLRMIKNQELDGKAVVYPHRRSDRILAVDRWEAADERRYLRAEVDHA